MTHLKAMFLLLLYANKAGYRVEITFIRTFKYANINSLHESRLGNSRIAQIIDLHVQGGSNMTGTDLYVNKPHCAAAVRP